MAGKTQYGPHGLPLRRYGSFGGKEAASADHTPGRIIQFGPHGLPMRRYGSFAGKAAAEGANRHYNVIANRIHRRGRR